MGAGRAKTHCRTQNILKYLVQHFILAETPSAENKKLTRAKGKKKELVGQVEWWDFGFVFSLDTSPVKSPELAVMPRDVGAQFGIPIHGLMYLGASCGWHGSGSYRYSPTVIQIYGKWAGDLAGSPGSGEQQSQG